MNVSYEAMDKTSRCDKDFSCLNGKNECLCEVENCIDDRVFFVNCYGKAPACNYRLEFGYSTVCCCPTREEIYIKYKV